MILLIHGITSSSATWDPVLPELASDARDRPGPARPRGVGQASRGLFAGALASILRDLLEHLGVERVTVVGHSLGGGVAMQFSHQYPEYCERIVLVDSGGLGREVSVALRAATCRGRIRAADHREHQGAMPARRWARCWAGCRCDPGRRWPRWSGDMRRSRRRQLAPPSSTPCAVWWSQVGSESAQYDRLYLSEGMPTLIIWGQLDTVIPVAHAHDAHAAIRAANWRSSNSRGTSRTWTSPRGSPGTCVASWPPLNPRRSTERSGVKRLVASGSAPTSGAGTAG